MFQLLLIAIIIAAFIAIRKIRQQPPEKRSSLTIRYALYGVAILLIGLVLTGKVHWLAGAIGAALPILLRLAPLLWRVLPLARQHNKQQDNHDAHAEDQEKAHQTPQRHSPRMDAEQALKVFGFEQRPESEEIIIQRHRELIQKNHPDRGGSDFLAAQINEARDVLLNPLNT